MLLISSNQAIQEELYIQQKTKTKNILSSFMTVSQMVIKKKE